MSYHYKFDSYYYFTFIAVSAYVKLKPISRIAVIVVTRTNKSIKF